MDAAAGVIGIVAFVQQLTVSIFKIKKFCDNVKNAPVDLQETLDQLSTMNSIIAQLANEGEATAVASPILQTCLSLCQKAVDRTSRLADDLQSQMHRRKYVTAITFELKRDTMKAMMQKLDRSKADLHLAYSMYVDARRHCEFESLREQLANANIVRQRTSDITQALRTQDMKSDTCDEIIDRANASPKSKPEKSCSVSTQVRLRLPFWLSQHAWDVLFEHSAGCWTMSLKSFRILPTSHVAFHICYSTGNVDDMRALLVNKTLSIHDQFDDGSTPFSAAAQRGHTKLAQFLIEIGVNADLSLSTYGGWWNFYLGDDEIPGGTWTARTKSLDGARAHAKLLTDHSQVPESKLEYLEALARPPATWTASERLRCIIGEGTLPNSLHLLDMLDVDNIDSALFHMRTTCGETFLHFVAFKWAMDLTYMSGFRKSTQLLRDATWENIVHQAVKAKADLHAADDQQRTPLTVFMNVLVQNNIWNEQDTDDVNYNSIQKWTQVLANAGVDLFRYGKDEHRNVTSWGLGQLDHHWYRHQGLMFFTYSAKSSDWRLWYRQPGDIYAGSFWDLIENPSRSLPGAWVDNDDATDYDDTYRIRTCGIKRARLRRFRAEVKLAKREQRPSLYEPDLVEELNRRVQTLAGCEQDPASDQSLSESLKQVIRAMSALGEVRGTIGTPWEDCIELVDEDLG